MGWWIEHTILVLFVLYFAHLAREVRILKRRVDSIGSVAHGAAYRTGIAIDRLELWMQRNGDQDLPSKEQSGGSGPDV